VSASLPRIMDGKYFTRPSPSRYEGRLSMISFHMAASRKATARDIFCSRQV